MSFLSCCLRKDEFQQLKSNKYYLKKNPASMKIYLKFVVKHHMNATYEHVAQKPTYDPQQYHQLCQHPLTFQCK